MRGAPFYLTDLGSMDQTRPTTPAPAATTSIVAVSNDARTTGVAQRLVSLDVYRGLIMVSLAFAGFGLGATARRHLDQSAAVGTERTGPSAYTAFWSTVQGEFDHRQWIGCSYWDLIQPSFMFMVGTAMAYSLEKRRSAGDTPAQMLVHTLRRALVLVALGVFLSSNWSRTTEWSFVNVLSQIGLGYPFLYFLWNRSPRKQGIAAAAILAGTWIAYVAYPHAGINLETGAPDVGVSARWAQEHLAGVSPSWHKNANVGHAFDVWFLNLFPRRQPFAYNSGGYVTLNFVPSLATMTLGLMAGTLLQSARPPRQKLLWLVGAGLMGLFLGQVLHITGICPLVRRIWTPAFALFSSGWCLIILGTLYAVVDMLRIRWWTFPFVVAGANSIALYLMHMLIPGWIGKSLETHLGSGVFQLQLGHGNSQSPSDAAAREGLALWEPTIEAVLVGAVMWAVCWWMYRQKIFVRV